MVALGFEESDGYLLIDVVIFGEEYGATKPWFRLVYAGCQASLAFHQLHQTLSNPVANPQHPAPRSNHYECILPKVVHAIVERYRSDDNFREYRMGLPDESTGYRSGIPRNHGIMPLPDPDMVCP